MLAIGQTLVIGRASAMSTLILATPLSQIARTTFSQRGTAGTTSTIVRSTKTIGETSISTETIGTGKAAGTTIRTTGAGDLRLGQRVGPGSRGTRPSRSTTTTVTRLSIATTTFMSATSYTPRPRNITNRPTPSPRTCPHRSNPRTWNGCRWESLPSMRRTVRTAV